MSQTEATAADLANTGQWQAVFPLPNVMIHAHLLPDGKVLFWGRRDHKGDSLDVHACTPLVWNPAEPQAEPSPIPQPLLADGHTTINLFCSGHAFLPDGRLLVAGGHFADSKGLNQASTYDWKENKWTALPALTIITLISASCMDGSGH